ncbi:HAD hydrolase-like protein [Granulicella tundricola]|uniref:phosphoglycolate phosphatase n=1 Tax=Granulicella tundricola (strain ATCC BAA-1859 / DSM 23138 / MP5ACTX9) TaxID=1198114 RepID=E8WWW6_GRATM|nr:HAD hydrolase-like protein [Granulicella tundricola]ADW68527.1 Haloacid dehalogenase domain protein hydrolase [Granulicella tundricola MP5ACTX9]
MLLITPQLLVFDLDGTLIDSRTDLCNSVNATLEHFGQPALPENVVASYIGDGVQMLVRRALGHAHMIAAGATEDAAPSPHDDALINEATRWFISYYHDHKLDFTYVYPGVIESLEQIRSQRPDLPMAVLTNKPVHPSRDICRHFGMDRFFFKVYGGNSFANKKPDPAGLHILMGEASLLIGDAITPGQTVMIGDSHVDVETARNAGTHALGCTFGLSPQTLALAKPDVSVDSAFDWPSALNL